MRHALVISDWWSSVLLDATADRPNLDDPRNVVVIDRLAGRYDVVVIVSPHWHTVGTQVRDRLRAAANRHGRSITLLRYVGSLSLRWGDQPGAMSVVPVSTAVTATGVVRRPAWLLRASNKVPIRSVVMGGASHLVDPGNTEVIATAKAHLLSLAAGWDGIFIDEVGPSYHRLQLVAGQVDPRYRIASDGSCPAYETARRGFLKAVTAHLTAHGKKVGANIDPKTTTNGFFPANLVADSPGLTHPFVEIFGTNWEGQAVGSASWDHPVTLKTMDWLRACASQGRSAIVNAYTRQPASLRYALSLFLAAAGPDAAFSGNRPGSNDEYSTEPVWLDEYDAVLAIGAPSSTTTTVTVTVRRMYDRGCVVANVTSSPATVDLGGAFRAPAESADTTRRTLDPVSGAVLTGRPFGNCAPDLVATPGALKLVGDIWCQPVVVATPVGRTNLWSANPGFRSNLSGWAASAATMVRMTGGPDGIGVLSLAIAAGSQNGRTWNTTLVAVTPGGTLHLTVWARARAAQSAILAVDWYDGAGGYLSYDYGEVSLESSWARVGRALVVPARAASMSVTVQYVGTAALATSIDLTGWLLEDVPDGTYFDGSTPSVGGLSHAWSGTINASVSTATPMESMTGLGLARMQKSVQPSRR